MSRFTILALCFAVFAVSESVGQNNQVCLTLSQQGAVGVTGSKGDQGDKGEKGDVESCGCKPGDIDELREQVRVLRVLQSCIGMVYDNYCIRLAYAQGRRVNYTEAEEICGNHNATLAEITSDEMYNVVYQYVQEKWMQYMGWDWDYGYVWLGSTFLPRTSNTNDLITLRNGNKVRLENWFDDYPKKGPYSDRTQLVMAVQTNGVSSYRFSGILNVPSVVYGNIYVPLCATKLVN